MGEGPTLNDPQRIPPRAVLKATGAVISFPFVQFLKAFRSLAIPMTTMPPLCRRLNMEGLWMDSIVIGALVAPSFLNGALRARTS
jgi:hypothetical protein